MEYYSAMKKLSQKSFNVIEMKDTTINEISQKQKDHVLFTIFGNLREVGMRNLEELSRVPEGRNQKKWALSMSISAYLETQ